MPALTIDQIIVKPLITEKNTDLMEHDQYTFEVAATANKIQIREAIEKTFNVRVKAVNTMNVKPNAAVTSDSAADAAGSTVTSAPGRRPS